MQISDNLIILIKKFEGLYLRPYLDAVKRPTIGYGSTYYQDGTPVTMNDPYITEDQATDLLKYKLNNEFVPGVNNLVIVQLTQGQFDALVDFSYNCGLGNLKNSTLLKLVNQGNFTGASAQFNHWIYAGGKELPGLVRRRQAETDLFNS